MGRGLLETRRVVDLGEVHLDGDGVQAHHRVSRVPARGLGRFEGLVDDFQASVALAAKHQMVGVAQERLQVGFLLPGERELEDGFEVKLDRIDLAVVFSLCRRGGLRPGFDQSSLRQLQKRSEPIDPSRARAPASRSTASPAPAWPGPGRCSLAGSVSFRICRVMMRSQVMRSIDGQSAARARLAAFAKAALRAAASPVASASRARIHNRRTSGVFDLREL